MDDRYIILEKFLENGMDISRFKFQSLEDKTHLFNMYKEYFIGLNNGIRPFDTMFDMDSNLIILLDDEEFCKFEVTQNYETIFCHTIHGIHNEDLMFVLTTFFMTLKELNSMIETLTDMFNLNLGAPKKNEDTNSKSKWKKLPNNVISSMNKIKTLQKSILNNNEKYKSSSKDKEKK